jgi:hypothetical protein
MWREWTKKIKTFAEDITSPDYDDDDNNNARHDADEVGNNEHHPGGAARAGRALPGNAPAARDTRGICGDASSSLLLETPARRLDNLYDEPTVERPTGGMVSAVVATPQLPSGATQPSASMKPPAASATASPVSQPRSQTDGEGTVASNAASQSAAQSAAVAGVPTPSAAALTDATYSKVSSVPSASASTRRGPPLAKSTPHPHPQQHQLQTSTADAATASPSLSSSPATLSCTRVEKVVTQAKATPADTATDISAAMHESTAPAVTSTPPALSPPSSASAMVPVDQHNAKHAAFPSDPSPLQFAQQQQQRIVELEAANAQMLSDIRAYQEEVRVAHEQTVAYYETQLSATQREHAAAAAVNAESVQEEMDRFRVALQTAAQELEAEHAAKTKLEKQVTLLKQEAAELQAALSTAASSHTDAGWAEQAKECADLRDRLQQQQEKNEQSAAHADLLQATEEARKSLELQLRDAQAQLTALQASTTAVGKQQQPPQESREVSCTLHQMELAALQEESQRWRLQAEELQEKLSTEQQERDTLAHQLAEEKQKAMKVAQTNPSSSSSSLFSAPTSAAEVTQLKQQVQAAEAARRALETQLSEAQGELMAALTSARQQQHQQATKLQQEQEQEQLQLLQAQHAQEVEALTLELQSAQQHAAELEQQLASSEEKNQRLTTQVAVEQAKSAAAHEGVTAASRAATEEAKSVTQKLQTMEGQCAALKAEVQQNKQTIDQLTSRLKAETQAHKDAIVQLEGERAEAEAALEDELAEVKAVAAKGQQKLEEQVEQLRAEVQREQKQLTQAAEECRMACAARDSAEAKLASSLHQRTTLEDERAALQQALQQCKENLAQQQQQVQRLLDKEANSSAGFSLAAVTNVKRELEEKVQTLEVTVDQVRRMTVDTLVRLGVDVTQALQKRKPTSTPPSQKGAQKSSEGAPRSHSPTGSSGDGSNDNDDSDDDNVERRRQRNAQDQLPLLQLLSLLTTECVQQHSIVLRAERVQHEWEQTYEQARQVNESLNQQVTDAWATIGKLREEVSVKEAAARQMQTRVGSGDARLVEVQEELSRVNAELQQLHEERESWAARLQQAKAGAEGQEQAAALLHEELQSLQTVLQAKDEELQASQQSSENLQMVLDRFQETKRHEVEVLTLETQLEVEALKKELAESQHVVEQHTQEKAVLRRELESQLAARDVEVTTLHRKLAEVRKAREKTTSRHMDGTETSVDKRVVSQLLAKYIHAFIGQRKEAEDMLKVLSGLLDWDEATQELAGLLPGPNNPHPPGISGADGQRGGSGSRSRTGLFGWRRAKPAAAGDTPAGGETPNNKAGLASMWVEFLLKESEDSSTRTASGAPATPSMPQGAATEDSSATAAGSATTTTMPTTPCVSTAASEVP